MAEMHVEVCQMIKEHGNIKAKCEQMAGGVGGM